MIGKASLNAEGKRVLNLLVTKYGMQEDKAYQLIKELLSPLLSPVVAKSQSDAEIIASQQQELKLLREQNGTLLEKLRVR
jgi:hypothetical protein